MIYDGKRVEGAHFADGRGDLWLVRVKRGRNGAKYAMIIWGKQPGVEIDTTDEELMDKARHDRDNDYIMLPGEGLRHLSRVAWWSLS